MAGSHSEKVEWERKSRIEKNVLEGARKRIEEVGLRFHLWVEDGCEECWMWYNGGESCEFLEERVREGVDSVCERFFRRERI